MLCKPFASLPDAEDVSSCLYQQLLRTFAPLVWVHADGQLGGWAELAHAATYAVAWQQEALQMRVHRDDKQCFVS
jgi:hypothetical protein